VGERFNKWEPVAGIEWPCAGVRISNSGRELVLTLEFSAVVAGGALDLQLRAPWGCVVGFASWHEFAHPWNNEVNIASLPSLGNAWPNHTFPLLEVTNSHLLASLGDGQRASYPSTRHFRIVTMDHTVDVLATEPPEATWLAPATAR